VHTPGHLGLGFAGAAGIVLLLAVAGLSHLAVVASVLFVALSPLPDVDEWLPWTAHRGGTHSVWFALAVGAGTALLAVLFGTALAVEPTTGATLGFGVGFLAVALHVLADAFTPMGVYPLWPASTERRSLNVLASANPRANRYALAGGLGLWLLTVGLVF